MLWKLTFGLGVTLLILSIVFIIIALRAFYSAGFQSETEDLAFGGLLMSIILLVVSLLITAVAGIFVLRNSKKDWDAKNLK